SRACWPRRRRPTAPSSNGSGGAGGWRRTATKTSGASRAWRARWARASTRTPGRWRTRSSVRWGNSRLRQSGVEERGHDLVGVEAPEILDALSDAHPRDRYLERVTDANHHAALRGPVQLSQDQTGDPDGFVELLRLGDGVLSDGSVED